MPTENYRRIDEDIAVDENNISNEMATIPSKYAYWYTQFAEAKKILRDKKIAFDIWMAECRDEVTKKATAENKKLTEQGKEDAIIITFRKEYEERQLDISSWMFKVDNLNGGVDALNIKSKELMTIASNQRTERELSAERSLKQR